MISTLTALANIDRVYQSVTPTDRIDGLLWYAHHYIQLGEIARQWERDTQEVCAIAAILSQDRRWSTVLGLMSTVLDRLSRNEPLTGLGFYGPMRDKVARLYYQGDYSGVSGRKVVPFFKNLCGDYTCLTIDRHMISAILGEYVKPHRKEYDFCTDALTTYMSICSWQYQPAQFQAVLWVNIIRNRHRNRK